MTREAVRPKPDARTARALAIACALIALSPCTALAQQDDARFEALERRVEELEAERDEARREAESKRANADWTRHVRLGGSGNFGWYEGQEDGVIAGSGLQVRDLRLFVDAELGESLEAFGHTVVRNAGFSFEWNVVRIGELFNDVGEAYVELQGIAGSDWLNFQAGRFQIPVGEAYLRYSRGRWTNPFISQPVSGTWFWDEGFKLYGGDARRSVAYIASITANETAFNSSVSDQKQYTLKLIHEPRDWLRLSASFLYGGRIGSATTTGSGGGLWLGETWARGVGGWTDVPVIQDGVEIPDGPPDVASSWYVGGDVVLDLERKLRLWLSYGAWSNQSDVDTYDRLVHAWIAELVLEGALASPLLETFYLGARASGLGTYDDARGYSYDSRTLSQVGYNARSLEEYSAVLGWRPIRHLVVRFEYTHRRSTMVSGAPAAQLDYTDDLDAWGIEIGAHF